MTEQEERIKAVLSGKSSRWKAETEFLELNKPAIDRAFEIALLVMDILDEKGWSQSDLAREMNVSRQAVSKILKGNRPISMPTVDKLETALGVQLLKVNNRADLQY